MIPMIRTNLSQYLASRAHSTESNECGIFILRYDIDDGRYTHIPWRYWTFTKHLRRIYRDYSCGLVPRSKYT